MIANLNVSVECRCSLLWCCWKAKGDGDFDTCGRIVADIAAGRNEGSRAITRQREFFGIVRPDRSADRERSLAMTGS